MLGSLSRLGFATSILAFAISAGSLSAAILPGGRADDHRISVGYEAATGRVFLETAKQPMEQMLILSANGLFSGDPSPLELCDAVFCQDTDFRIEKLSFGEAFTSYSFGNVAAKNLSESKLLADWSVSGRYFPQGSLDGSAVDLIYIAVPEPSTGCLAMGAALLSIVVRRQRIRRL